MGTASTKGGEEGGAREVSVLALLRLLGEREGARAHGRLLVGRGEAQLDLRLDLTRAHTTTPRAQRQSRDRCFPAAACPPLLSRRSLEARQARGRTSAVPSAFGSLMKAWPPRQPGGRSPVVPIFRHSMIVCRTHSAREGVWWDKGQGCVAQGEGDVRGWAGVEVCVRVARAMWRTRRCK